MADGFDLVIKALSTVNAFRVAAAATDVAAAQATARSTLYLQARVRAHASGRPGPNVLTGDYRRGITARVGLAATVGGRLVPAGEVFTNSPQARRLEYGFVGADVLGRVYNQPAFPHFAPAVAETAEYLRGQSEELLARTLSGGGEDR